LWWWWWIVVVVVVVVVVVITVVVVMKRFAYVQGTCETVLERMPRAVKVAPECAEVMSG
jgi:uncharacterized membrane protein